MSDLGQSARLPLVRRWGIMKKWFGLRLRAVKVSSVIAAGCLLAVSGCDVSESTDNGGSQGDDVAPFCSTVGEHKTQFEQAAAASTSTNELANLVTFASAIGDIQAMWADLVDVAPADIKSDVQEVHDAWATAEDKAVERDVLGALTNAVLNSGSVSRVNSYIAENCGTEYAPLGGGRSTTTSTAASSAAVLDQEFTDDDGYRYRVVINGPATYDSTVDVVNSKPGSAAFGFTLQTTGTIYNETSGRNAPFPEGMVAAALWSEGSQACSTLGSQLTNADVNSNYCGRQFETFASSTTIPAGSSLSFSVVAGLNLPISIPEASADEIEASFERPDGWAVITGITGMASAPDMCVSDLPAC